MHVQELGLSSLIDVVEVEDIDPDASRVNFATVFAMPHMVSPSRVSLLHLVGVDGVLLVVSQNAVLLQVIGVAGVPKRVVKLPDEPRDVRRGKGEALGVCRVEVAGLIFLNVFCLDAPVCAVSFLRPLKILNQAVTELVGHGIVVYADEVVVLYLDGHLNFGQLPGAGGSQRLPRAIGPIRAKQLMFTGDLIAARDALALGLVGEVVDDASLLERARAIAGSLATRSPTGVRGMKRLVNEGLQQPLAQALRFEINFVTDYATGCPDATEGLLAFAEKRTPRYMR